MKINGLTPAGKGGEQGKKTEQATGPSFGSFLQDALKTGAPSQAQPVPMPFSASPISPVNGLDPVKQAEQLAASMVETTLSDLEIYQNSLSNPVIPASRLQPMAQSLMNSKDNLVSMLSKINDKSLKGIVSQTAGLIISENSRLNTAAY
jgi:hypothetical protein